MAWKQLYGILPFFVSSLLALSLALTYKLLKRRLSRRSPLASKQIGHVPGQQLVTRMSDHQTDMVLAVMLMYMALPLVFMMWAGSKIDWSKFHMGTMEWIYITIALGVFGYGLRDYIRNLHARDNIRDGLLAERVTGMQLNRLIAQGCIVLHDLPGDGFNIDHVVIAPRGIYAVETKSFRKPRNASDDKRDPGHQVSFDGNLLRFPDFATREPLEQAKQQAQWLQRWLREALKQDIPVTPALSLPGWYVSQSDDVWRNSPVKVFTPMGEGANFMAKDIIRLDPTMRSLVATALAQRFPVTAD